ncbi:MAG: amidase [Chloroflexota bacterium]|nr:amidase [Chloroflexota bacterium]MDE2883776.1 amidase [Chloroflexota bacterium]
MTDITSLPASDLAGRIAAKEISSTEAVGAFVAHADALGPEVRVFITPTFEQAMADARTADTELAAGRPRGPLHGVPFGVKDIYWSAGIPTTSGSALDAEFVPDEDATAVRLLREAGAIPVGKVNTVEFAFGPTGQNATYGMPRNPWGEGRMPGGSSSGTGAGVASGFFPMGLGSDTGGSIRIPSALCGISGIKPTFGLVSRYGVTPLSHSLDTAGPMARTVEDLALMLNVLAGPDERDPVSITAPRVDYVASLQGGIGGLRVGVPVQYVWEPLDTDVALAFEAAMRTLEGLGAQVMEISLPELEWTPPVAAGITIAEATMAHGARVLEHGDRMDQVTRRRFESGFFVPATAYAKAQRARVKYARAVAQALTRVDLIAMPTVATPAPLAEQDMLTLGGVEISSREALLRLTRVFNLARMPSASVPCGFSPDALPIGLMLGGARLDDALVLRAVHTYQAATDWHLRQPPLG